MKLPSLLLSLVASSLTCCDAFVTTHQQQSTSKTQVYSTTTDESKSHWMDYLKFDGTTPDFDVIEKTIQYTNEPGYKSFNLKEIPAEYYSNEYIFRGPIVGPINRQDLVQTNIAFDLETSFPDLQRETWGHCIDPENPYRVMFFERWKATNSGPLKLIPTNSYKPPTNNKSISPVMPFSVCWTPDGTIIYEHLTTALDRFEGNTKGKVAVFGLLETAGLSINNNVGDPILAFLQKTNRSFNGEAQVFSRPEDVPSWWKSKAVGAEPNDM